MRRWLGLSAVATTSIVVLAFLIPLAALVQDLAADRALASAERDAQGIAQLAAATEPTPLNIDELERSLPANVTIEVGPDRTIGAVLPAGLDLSPAAALGEAFRQDIGDGQAVVVPVLKESGLWIVVLTVPDEALRENVAAAWIVLTALGIALVAVAALVADRLGRSIVRPIQDIVTASHRLGSGELEAAVVPSGPAELKEVGTAFNTLSQRVADLLEHEREAIADLSHRLRTPLTALKLDVEALEKTTDVSRLQRDIDAMERTVTHLIHEARRPIRQGGGATTDFAFVVTERTDYWGALAEDQNRVWTLSTPEDPCRVSGRSTDYVAAIDALIGNVFAHTPVGTGYSLALSVAGGSAVLFVTDQGSGLANQSLLDRGTSSAGSTGLGIDIVRNTIEAAGGTARWSSGPDAGTTVLIQVPLI